LKPARAQVVGAQDAGHDRPAGDAVEAPWQPPEAAQEQDREPWLVSASESNSKAAMPITPPEPTPQPDDDRDGRRARPATSETTIIGPSSNAQRPTSAADARSR